MFVTSTNSGLVSVLGPTVATHCEVAADDACGRGAPEDGTCHVSVVPRAGVVTMLVATVVKALLPHSQLGIYIVTDSVTVAWSPEALNVAVWLSAVSNIMTPVAPTKELKIAPLAMMTGRVSVPLAVKVAVKV